MRTTTLALAALAAAGLTLAACGGTNPPATVRVHGSLGNGILGSQCVSGGDQVKITTAGASSWWR
jgi:hypothetical protein